MSLFGARTVIVRCRTQSTLRLSLLVNIDPLPGKVDYSTGLKSAWHCSSGSSGEHCCLEGQEEVELVILWNSPL